MTGIKTTGEKKLMLFSGRAHPELAEEVAEELGVELTPTTAYDFANGEIFVRFEESVRGCDAFVLQSHTAPINKWIMEQLIMVDALKRASAKRITVVVPFYGYARQDKKHRGREPISARLMADLFKTAGADRLMTVDLHTAQIQGFFDGPVDHLFALPLLAELRRAAGSTARELTVVSPDAGRVRVAERWTDVLGGARWRSSTRRRDPRRPERGRSPTEVVGDVEGRICVAGRRHDRHRRHDREGGRRAVRRRRRRRRSSPRPTRSSPARPSTGCKNCRISEVVVTDTLPIPRGAAASTSSPCCRSPRCSPARSARSSTTARSPACSTATPDAAPRRSAARRASESRPAVSTTAGAFGTGGRA